MVRPKFLAALEKWLMFCKTSSVWTRRAQSSANSSSVMSSSMVFVRTRRGKRLKRLPSVQKRMWMPSGRSSFASQSMMLKMMENNVGIRINPCLSPLEIGKLPDRDPLCFT